MTRSLKETYAAAVANGVLAPDPAQQSLLAEFDAIREYLDQPKKRGLRGMFSKSGAQPKGLYLWGGVGRGKSMLMDMFFDTIQAPKRRVHFHAFMQEIHAAMHEARKTGVDDALKPVAQKVASDIALLAFDEMQISDITDAMIVGRLFEQLFAAGVIVVTTSNRAPDDLYQNGLNRALFVPFIDLLKQHMLVHHLQSPTDYRQDRLSGSKVYYSPLNSENRQAFDALWQEMAGEEATALTLHVKGREVVLPAYSNGVARVDFWDLCGKPLGAGDYLAIADAVRVLFLENVPSLGRSNFNEAKRFVTLIDALYEAKVRLVISAAAPPDRLYVEGEGTFEFERTASRLVEMQSDGWGDDGKRM